MEEKVQEQFLTKTLEAVMASVQKYMKEEMDKIDQKYLIHAVSPEEEKRQLEMKDAERFVNLLQAMGRKDYGRISQVSQEIETERKAVDPQLEGTANVGGILVPAVTEAKILRLIPTFSQARQEMTVVPMGKTTQLTLPKKLTNVSVASVDEKGKIASSKATLGSIQLLAKKWAGLTVFSSELIADASVGIVDFIISLFAEALGQFDDNQFFKGTGSPFTGVFNVSSTYGKNVEIGSAVNATNLTYEKLLSMVYGIDQNYLSGAKWFGHRTVMEVLRGIKDDNKRPLFVDANAGGMPTFMGYSFKMIESAPPASTTTDEMPVLLLGNLKNSYIGDKEGLRIDYSSEAMVDDDSLFQNDLSAVRIIKRGAFNAGLTEAYAVATVEAGV